MTEDDDYLSDKFLLDSASASSAPKTYSQLRKEAQRQAKSKNDRNKLKSRHQRELESREEGLSKSLFERAIEEEKSGTSQGNKALNIMMKMGFKPGQALGQSGGEVAPSDVMDGEGQSKDTKNDPVGRPNSILKHKTEPLPINDEWKGKKGIGMGKRAPSPTSAERVAKMAKMAETSSHDTFRDRTRQAYEERRAEGRLRPSQQTCITLDEKAGKSFNVLWLDPNEPESFPEGLVDALERQHALVLERQSSSREQKSSIEARLRLQMQADALRPLSVSDDDTPTIQGEQYTSEIIQEAAQFVRLNAQDRLGLILAYLRDRYAYCFWCGTQYDDQNELEEQCPGMDEEAHD